MAPSNEPTIARNHLIKVLEQIPGQFLFILETNGILIGHDKTYADDLARFENLYVRVSFKGANEEEFSALTGAEPAGFELQIKALESLYRAGVRVHPAVMASFSTFDHVLALKKRLGKIDPEFKGMCGRQSLQPGGWLPARHGNLPGCHARIPLQCWRGAE